MRRFFVSPNSIEGDTVRIVGEDSEHISRVLRMRTGDLVSIADGAGNEYISEIVSFDAGAITLTIKETRRCEAEPPYTVTLFQGMPKGDKLEGIIQKAVELGVSAVAPIVTARSVSDGGKFEKKLVRYNRIAQEAAKQSGRGVVPRVAMPVTIDAIDLASFDLILLPYEEERGRAISEALTAVTAPRRIAVIIGPEGGFETNEVTGLTAKGALSVSLGKRILRTETAGPAVLAMLMYEYEV